jgi:DNA-directed RNA polymerase subunit alpha
MSIIPLPNKITWEDTGTHESRLIIEPCSAGYGTTLGNALRRVLLSSLPGAAVTKIKVKKVDHEFSTIPGVKEDLVEIMLNLKNLRIRNLSEEPVKLHLKVKGKLGEVKASDIEKNADVEIIDKDFVMATITDKKADLDVEMTVERGYGYLPVEERKNEEKEVGVIYLDAFFSPVRSVGFEVTPARVGQDINYDRLTMNITTDGSLTPKSAVDFALAILLEHFILLKEKTSTETEITVKAKEKSKKKPVEKQ